MANSNFNTIFFCLTIFQELAKKAKNIDERAIYQNGVKKGSWSSCCLCQRKAGQPKPEHLRGGLSLWNQLVARPLLSSGEAIKYLRMDNPATASQALNHQISTRACCNSPYVVIKRRNSHFCVAIKPVFSGWDRTSAIVSNFRSDGDVGDRPGFTHLNTHLQTIPRFISDSPGFSAATFVIARKKFRSKETAGQDRSPGTWLD